MKTAAAAATSACVGNCFYGKQGDVMNNVFRLQDGRDRQAGNLRTVWPVPDGNNGMAELLRMLGANLSELRGVEPMPVAVRRLHAGDMLFHEGAAAEAMHFVRAGTFKIFRTAEDGYEQVLGFAGRGEVMGFDAISAGTHPTAAMALEDSSVFVVLLSDFFSLGQRISALDTLVHRAASSALANRAELADVMAAVAAEVRLTRFLMQLSQRMAACGQSPRRFHLRMSRRDIASYLGVAHETVSRSFSALVRWGLVRVDNREVEVLDMPGLRAFALNTRRQVDDAIGSSFARAQSSPHDPDAQVS
jgi:CRP/FNR family transcriptional regulator, anaerobic regulatory protein